MTESVAIDHGLLKAFTNPLYGPPTVYPPALKLSAAKGGSPYPKEEPPASTQLVDQLALANRKS